MIGVYTDLHSVYTDRDRVYTTFAEELERAEQKATKMEVDATKYLNAQLACIQKGFDDCIKLVAKLESIDVDCKNMFTEDELKTLTSRVTHARQCIHRNCGVYTNSVSNRCQCIHLNATCCRRCSSASFSPGTPPR